MIMDKKFKGRTLLNVTIFSAIVILLVVLEAIYLLNKDIQKIVVEKSDAKMMNPGLKGIKEVSVLDFVMEFEDVEKIKVDDETKYYMASERSTQPPRSLSTFVPAA